MKRLRPFWFALGFLTTLPVPPTGNATAEERRRSVFWYPLVGWVVGGVLAVVAALAGAWPPGLEAALVLAAWLAVTGMLHLDGLLDSADALLAPRPPGERLKILTDVHHGSFALGVGAVFLILKWQAIAAGPGLWALALAPVAARAWILPLLGLFRPARPGGLGAGVRGGTWGWGFLFAAPLALLAPGPAVVAGAWALGFALWASRRLGGGLTGDVYGAAVETTELVFLLAALFWKAPGLTPG
ncbi:adenosylcobinamide-GDP ribazoletransferase [Oceanithermus sp.]|uniref:adenosylcobinamide-GDP ribazoletransferase n=1 Tax=Oceanithermus sp. TaxID=2268145 RepID=UPI00257E060D|nr:adenosylcobinamide-GDP ribazoletransferase [Oceanithermus sp.]